MKLSLNWLKEFLAIPSSVDSIVNTLTFAGVEVEGLEERASAIDQVVVAQIDSFGPHPNADRLSVCHVNDGTGLTRQVVCGAKNFSAGDKVPLALPGAVLPNGLKIAAARLRGVVSEGMLCSAKELNIGEDSEGLLILPSDTKVGIPLSQVFPPDTVLEVETTPNRGDLLSHFGVVRELAALFALPSPRWPAVSTAIDRLKKECVRIDAPDGCPFYSARLIRAVKVGPSPQWLKRRLETLGIRSINNVVDVTNYVLMEVGQPLHVFDYAKVEKGIVVRRADPNEKLVALDGKEYRLEPEDLLIADSSKALAIAGVMGGEESGVVAATRDLLLEAAYFNPASIRRTSRRLGLFSDSSFRFERGIDPRSVLSASARATDLILQVAGGAAEEQIFVGGTVPDLSRVVEMRPARCSALLGMEVPDAAELLKHLGLKSIGGNHWEVPSFRQDLLQEIDLIEEVCRLAGVQKIPSRIFGAAAESSEADRAHDDLMQLRHRLVGLGLMEARTLTLVDSRALDFMLESKAGVLALRNPLVEDQGILRPSLLYGLVRAAERNFNRGAAGVALFEIGRVFRVADAEESLKLAIIVSGERVPKSWKQSGLIFDLFDLKGILEAATRTELALRREQSTAIAPLVCRILDDRGRALGLIGQIRPSLAKELGSKGAITLAEMDLPLDESPERFTYRALDRFPPVVRDVAFLAGKKLKYQTVIETLRAAREPLLQEVTLFDLFVDPTGEKVPLDKKSMACSLTYRASDRTLVLDEVNEAHQRLKSRLVKGLDVVLRE